MKYMPTVKCPQCDTEFSAMLAECPHCGKRRTRETDKEFAIRPEAEAAPAEKQPPVEKPKRKAPAWQSVLGVLLVVIGLVAAGLGGLLAVWAVVSKFALDGTVPGWTSLLIAVVFLGGVQLITIGVMGEYVGRIYDEVKQRPLYVLRKDSPAPEEKR